MRFSGRKRIEFCFNRQQWRVWRVTHKQEGWLGLEWVKNESKLVLNCSFTGGSLASSGFNSPAYVVNKFHIDFVVLCLCRRI